MRPLWKGSVSFGLVHIPVKLYAATERQDVKFNYLHGVCHTPVRYRKWCPTCDREITQDEVVWGYEVEKGRYVVLTEADFERLPLPSAKTVEILDFISLAEIDPIFFDKTYFLEPADAGAVRAYALLRRSLSESGRVALARVAIRSKESLACVRVYARRALAMETMFYPEEVRSAAKLEGIEAEPELRPQELQMARLLIDSLSAPFEPARYVSQYRAALRQLLEAKLAGRQLTGPPEPTPAPFEDLMEALRKSLAAVEEQRQAEPAARS